MNAGDPDILGNGVLYARLCEVTEVLGKFVSGAPRAVGIAQLEKQTGRTARELQKICVMLSREGLLRPSPQLAQHWTLTRDASEVTLEDAFRCVMTEKLARGRPAKTGQVLNDTSRREVDLLVMQATMGIQQSVLLHLRRFSLDRLKAGTASSSPRCNVWPRLSYT